MKSLADALLAPDTRPRVALACVALVGKEVAARTGITGLAIRAGYAAVNAVRPTFVQETVDRLLPEFAAALEPLHAEAPGPAFEAHLAANAERAATALLGVTDRRIDQARSAVRKTYGGLRGIAHAQVKASVPGLATTLAPFLR